MWSDDPVVHKDVGISYEKNNWINGISAPLIAQVYQTDAALD
jgi:hypothetical protein